MAKEYSQIQDETLLDDQVLIDEPKLYKVLLHNDHYTTMDFVVMVLETVFYKSHEEAQYIMIKVHREGIGLCGIYPFDIAEGKVIQVLQLARKNEFPLKCTMEEA
ncbi:MAG: ATP-dependent Clp protease adapter ClpS [Calditrichaeota bacterium]|nr:MAG: ATP-dependent Clp protease adapter ClpS [Calditrichota bacterium]